MSDEMICDRCERRHGVVWFAPSDLWNTVMRKGDRGNPDEFSFCCPMCFMALAEERGVSTPGWLVTPFADGPVDSTDEWTTCEKHRITHLSRFECSLCRI